MLEGMLVAEGKRLFRGYFRGVGHLVGMLTSSWVGRQIGRHAGVQDRQGMTVAREHRVGRSLTPCWHA